MKSKVLITAYGKENIDKGIHLLSFDGKLVKECFLPVSGKCNLVIEYQDYYVISVKYSNCNKLEIVDLNFNLVKTYDSPWSR